MAEIVEFGKSGSANREASDSGEKEQEARTFARLAGLTVMAYERERLAAAKELGCRPTVLDEIVQGVRRRVAGWPGGGSMVGKFVGFHKDDGTVIGAICVASDGENMLLVLADGNGRTVAGKRSARE